MLNDVINNTCNEIARTVSGNTSKSIAAASYGTGIALATVTESGLLVDGIKQEYSKGDYLILDNLKNTESITTELASGPESHSHTIKTPDNQKAIEVGNRVLVAVIGVNAVIVGRISNG